jgi:hypothetical protein
MADHDWARDDNTGIELKAVGLNLLRIFYDPRQDTWRALVRSPQLPTVKDPDHYKWTHCLEPLADRDAAAAWCEAQLAAT